MYRFLVDYEHPSDIKRVPSLSLTGGREKKAPLPSFYSFSLLLYTQDIPLTCSHSHGMYLLDSDFIRDMLVPLPSIFLEAK